MRPSGRRARPWLWLVCTALVLVLAGSLSRVVPRRGGDPAPRRPAPSPAAPKPPGFEFQSTRLRVVDPRTARVAWELTLGQAEAATETGEVWLSGIEAVYHNPDGRLSRLTAGRGHLEPGGQALVFTERVTLSATNGGRLEAETLRWEAGREEFRAVGPPGGQVVLTRGSTVLRAAELRGDLALQRVRAAGGVRLSGAAETGMEGR